MSAAKTALAGPIPAKLDLLQAELTDLAFALDRRGRCDAADVALAVSVRIGEIRREFLVDVRNEPHRPLKD